MKKLNLAEVKSITYGVDRVLEKGGIFRFRRFTKPQEEYYFNTRFADKVFSTANVVLSFKTNSQEFFIRGEARPETTRRAYSIEIHKNGEFMDEISNMKAGEPFPDMRDPSKVIVGPVGPFYKHYYLGDGDKTITIYLPWSVGVGLSEILIDSNATLIPVKPRKKLIVYGDSITHGYDARYPSETYASILGRKLKMDVINKGIGGETYNKELATFRDNFDPDMILVAYGTNDFSRGDRNKFIEECTGFYMYLTEKYPNTPIYAVSPIWRADLDTIKNEFKDFGEIKDLLEVITKKYENVKVIDGFNFVPHDEKYFADTMLHPNSEGFSLYADALCEVIKK